MPDEEIDISLISPWVLRIELDREAMSDKLLTMEDITARMLAVYGETCCTSSATTTTPTSS